MIQEQVQLCYKEYGNGVPVILIHGFPFNGSIWEEIAARLSRSARLICPDLRGHGLSPAPEGIYTMELMARDVALMMDNQGIHKAVIVGHSLGGYISLAFLSLFAQRCIALGFVATQAGSDSPEKKKGRYQTVEKLENKGVEALTEGMPESLSDFPEIRDRIKTMIRATHKNGLIGALLGMAERTDYTTQLKVISVPALVVAGEQDKLIPIETAREMADLIPGSKIEIIPGTGHMPMMESPDLLSKVLLDFIKRV